MKIFISPQLEGGTVQIPASKSMAHRGLICAALAQGTSRIAQLTPSKDIAATTAAMAQIGAQFTQIEAGTVEVQGCGGKLQAPKASVWCGESGSTLRFLIPLFSLTGEKISFAGEGRLPQRPQEVYAHLFAQKGLAFTQTQEGVVVQGAIPPGQYVVDGSVSSQFISGLLFALPLCSGDSTLHITAPFESRSYVQLTLQAMADFGVQAHWQDAFTLKIAGKQQYQPCAYAVEGDFSQGAFFAVLGAVLGGVTVANLRESSAQGDRAILDILRQCGAQFTQTQVGEKTQYTFFAVPLQGIEIDLADCPDLGPILMVLGLFCQGTTVLRNAGRLRIKESDRIYAMETEIRKMGGCMESTQDTVTVHSSTLHGTENLDGHNDHRVVMAMSIAGLCAGVPVAIAGAQAVEKSYPTFFEALGALGVKVEAHEN